MDNCEGKPFAQLAEEVSKVIGVHRSEINTRNECYHLGLHNGIDKVFRDGHVGYGRNVIGTEIKRGRKTYIKVSDEARITKDNRHGNGKNFRLKHELLWKQAHGEIPNGCYLTGFFSNYPTQETIDKIFTFIDEHNITPFIGASFKFSDIKQAIKAQEKGVDGKIVVVMAQQRMNLSIKKRTLEDS